MSFRRILTALATTAALAAAAAPAASAATPTKAPSASDVFTGKLTKTQKAKAAAKAARTSPGARKAAKIHGKDGVYVTCGNVMLGTWGGYWIRCHIVVIGGAYGYEDWFEYDYWNGSSWSFWFNAYS
jgi:hypothetical protein